MHNNIHPTNQHEWAVRNDERPALLVAYPFLKDFQRGRHELEFRNWSLDSGAFTATNTGLVIDLEKFIDDCLELMATDPMLIEIFALDVDKNPAQTLLNCRRMWDRGVPAIPAWHIGEPESVLVEMAAQYPKIAVGGMATLRNIQARRYFCDQIFARVWPKKVHGFGLSNIRSFDHPWDSVDATSWASAPSRFGHWYSMGKYGKGLGKRLPKSGKIIRENIRREIDHYMRTERATRGKFMPLYQEIEQLQPAHSLCLAGHVERVNYMQQKLPGLTLRFATDGKDQFAKHGFSPTFYE